MGDQQDEQDDAVEWTETARRAATGVAGSIIGYVVADAPGAAVGGGAPAVLDDAFRWLGQQWRAQTRRNSERVLDVAADTADLSRDDMVVRLTADPKRLQVAGMALSAGAMTTDEDKLQALARSLAMAAEDDALVDPEMLVVAALTDMEAPHIKVLRIMATGASRRRIHGRRNHASYALRGLEHELPEVAGLMAPVLSTLLRHGLVSEENDLRASLDRRDRDRARFGGNSSWQPRPPLYRVTDFGDHCLDLLSSIEVEKGQGDEGQAETSEQDRPSAPSQKQNEGETS